MSTTEHTRHRLRVSVGPSAEPKDLKPIAPNDDAHPIWIESDEFVGQVVVRIKGLSETFGYEEGTKQDNIKPMPDSPWFHKPGADSNLSSVQIQGRFKRAWTGDQIVFGVRKRELSMHTCRKYNAVRVRLVYQTLQTLSHLNIEPIRTTTPFTAFLVYCSQVCPVHRPWPPGGHIRRQALGIQPTHRNHEHRQCIRMESRQRSTQ